MRFIGFVKVELKLILWSEMKKLVTKVKFKKLLLQDVTAVCYRTLVEKSRYQGFKFNIDVQLTQIIEVRRHFTVRQSEEDQSHAHDAGGHEVERSVLLALNDDPPDEDRD